MLKFLNLQPEVFGLDINDLSLKIVKLKKRGKNFILASYGESNIPRGIVREGVIQNKEILIKIIKSVCANVRGEKLGTNYVAMVLPEEKSFFQVIQMPEMTHEELKSAIQFEAENYIPLTMDKVYMDFQVIDKPKNDSLNHIDVLINVMPKPIVDTYVYCAKQAGLTPYILEVEPQAIIRALLKDKQNSPPIILIDLGQNNTNFIIFSGDSIKFTSSLSVYSEQFTQAISEELKISFHDAEKLKIKYGLILGADKGYNIKECVGPILHDLVNQIRKYIAFYRGHVFHDYSPSNNKIEKIILSGGGANLRGLCEFLSKELKVSVELGNPLINVTKNGIKISAEKALSLTSAIGLALRGANGLNE